MSADDRPSVVADGHRAIWTTAEVMAILGLTKSRVAQLAREFGLGTKLANLRVFSVAEVEQLRTRPDRRGRQPDPAAPYHAWRRRGRRNETVT